ALVVTVVLALTAGSALAAPPAKGPAIPRTRDGHPDFQAVVWTTPYMATTEIFPTFPPALTVSEDQARALFSRMSALVLNTADFRIDAEAASFFTESRGLPLVRGERRTRLLVEPADGKIPFTREARREVEATRAPIQKYDNPEDRPPGERCLTQGAIPPLAFTSPVHLRQFVQTRDWVALEVEYGDELRVIPFADHHGPKELVPDMGDSIARWDGDTLVVETTNFPAWSRMRAFPTSLIVNADAVVIERFTLVSPTELLYQFTVRDPKVYTAPWLAEYSLYPASGRMFPSNCHEGNYSLPNILSAARQAEAAAQKQAQATSRSP
ncbi:MAG TPA: hypothetical protein VFN88_12260, partial [Caulobacteraceae bacterium]|nr:hypothetical protein [Caulobacteraceae bacterium]